jgi:alkylated DNA repair dioxygenase AlkB
MSMQQSLFAELGTMQSPAMPNGFCYQEEIMSEAEEAALATALATVELKPFDFYGYQGNRNVASFGFRYNYATRSVEAATEFPPFIDELRKRAASFAGKDSNEIQQGGVNQYPPGAGIGWHKDKGQFGVVCVVSLLSPATLRLRTPKGAGYERRSQTVYPRSIYILDGEARSQWEHSVPPVASLRYSLTFRTMTGQ